MKTKRDVYKFVALGGTCNDIVKCSECIFENKDCHKLTLRLMKIGAMAILRQNRKKRVFDKSKILTCVTVDKAKVGMKGYFADNLTSMKFQLATKRIQTLLRIKNERSCSRFVDNSGCHWYLFYPIDEVEE